MPRKRNEGEPYYVKLLRVPDYVRFLNLTLSDMLSYKEDPEMTAEKTTYYESRLKQALLRRDQILLEFQQQDVQYKTHTLYVGHQPLYQDETVINRVQTLPDKKLQDTITKYQVLPYYCETIIALYQWEGTDPSPLQLDLQWLNHNLEILQTLYEMRQRTPEGSRRRTVFVPYSRQWKPGNIPLEPFSLEELSFLRQLYDKEIQNIDDQSGTSCMTEKSRIYLGEERYHLCLNRNKLIDACAKKRLHRRPTYVMETNISESRKKVASHSTKALSHGGIYTDNKPFVQKSGSVKGRKINLHGVTL